MLNVFDAGNAQTHVKEYETKKTLHDTELNRWFEILAQTFSWTNYVG
jgi:hypothetical protein